MGKQIIYLVLLLLLLTIPFSVQATGQQNDLVIVLLDNEQFTGVEGGGNGLLAALKGFAALAEAQGRRVRVYGPGNLSPYVTGNEWSTDLRTTISGEARISYTLREMNSQESKMEGADARELVFLVGNFGVGDYKGDDYDFLQNLDKMQAAEQAWLIHLTDESQNGKKNWLEKLETRLAELEPDGALHTQEYQAAQPLIIRMGSVLFDEVAMEQYELQLSQADQETEPAKESSYNVPLYSDLMGMPILYLQAEGEMPMLRIEDPNGQAYPLSLSGEGADVVHGWAAMANEAVFALSDLVQTVPGNWRLYAGKPLKTAAVYYQLLPIATQDPVVRVEMEGLESEPSTFLHTNVSKYQTVKLVLNEANPQLAALGTLLQERYGTQLKVLNGENEEALFLKVSKAGEYPVSVSLTVLDGEKPIGEIEQTITMQVINQPPVCNAIELPSEVQDQYWEIEEQQVVSLSQMFSDPDRQDTLTWQVQPTEDQADGQAFPLRVEGNKLIISMDQLGALTSPLDFRLQAEDGDGGQSEWVEFSFRWQSMQQALDSMQIVFEAPAEGSVLRKNEKVTIAFVLLAADGTPLSEQVLDFVKAHLQESAVLVTPGTGKDDEKTWELPINYNPEMEWFETDYTPTRIDQVSVTLRMTLTDSHIEYSPDFDSITFAVSRQKPQVIVEMDNKNMPETSNRKTVKWVVLDENAFTEADGDEVWYNIKVFHQPVNAWLHPFGGRILNNWKEKIEDKMLPYSFQPSDWGFWKVEITAEDDDGVSETVVRYYKVENQTPLFIYIGILTVMVILTILLIIWLSKPGFGKDSQLEIELTYGSQQDRVWLNAGSWKKKGIPLNRILSQTCILLNQDICKKLGDVSILPTRNGFMLRERNNELMDRNSDKASIDEPLSFSVDKLKMTVKLTRKGVID